MSQERVLKTLTDLGLTQLDAKVYVFLGKRGLQKGMDIAKALKVHKQQIYRSLKNLESKGIVTATLDHPARYSVEPFQKVIDLFIRAKMAEAQHLRQSKDVILQDWQSIAIDESEDTSEKFTVIKGRNIIYSKIQQMIQQTKKHLSTMTAVPNLVRADQFGLFDVAFGRPMRDGIRFRFLTELSEQNVDAVKDLLTRVPRTFNLEIRNPDLGLKLSRMVIRDSEEAIFFINPKTVSAVTEQDEVCLWTNCKSLVQAFTAVFEDLWHNSTDLQTKVVEIETGKPAPETCIIKDAKAAHKKYIDTMRSAEREIIMMASSEGLIKTWKNIPLFKQWAESGVSIRIMAPITSENLEAAQQLLTCCEVRHVPASYLGTTIIDGQHLFQFKNSPPEKEELKAMPYFENTFYTDDSEYVKKTENVLDDIWKNAPSPSAITLESIIIPSAAKNASYSERTIPRAIKKIDKISLVKEEKLAMGLTERDVLGEIINAQKYPKPPPKGVIMLYGAIAQAIIHPLASFSLPDILFHIMHYEKHSSHGAQQCMIICPWLQTPKGYAYVPVALIGDNPKAMPFWKKALAGLPLVNNLQLVKEDEFQVQVHGNTLFVAWTVQIPLPPSPFILPPSCILIEGYGDVKTFEYSVDNPSGYRVVNRVNGFEAFVTFFHPSSKYSGPGTEGFFCRDTISTSYKL